MATLRLPRVLGPVFYFDLVRLARRRRYFVLRTAYSVLLASLLMLLFFSDYVSGRARQSAQALADVSEQFFYVIVFIQMTAIFCLTPAYTAGALGEEKDGQTLEYVLTTDLTNKEIVLGKFAARILNLLLFVLVSLPVFAALQLLGGLSPVLILAFFAATLFTILSLGSLTMLCAVYATRTVTALWSTYGLLFFYGFLWLFGRWIWAYFDAYPETKNLADWISIYVLVPLEAGNPFMSMMTVAQEVLRGADFAQAVMRQLGIYALFHVIVAVVAAMWAVARVRAVYLRQRYGIAAKRTTSARLHPWKIWRPALGHWHPLIWKELFFARGKTTWLHRLFNVVVFLTALTPVAFFFVLFLHPQHWEPQELAEAMNWRTRICGTGVQLLALLAIGYWAASTVANEKTRLTWDSLMLTPLPASEIYFAKWFGSLAAPKSLYILLAIFWGLGVATGGIWPPLVPLMLAAFAAYAIFMASLGMVCASTQLLRSLTLTILAGLFSLGFYWCLCACFLAFIPIPIFDLFDHDIVGFLLGFNPTLVMGLLPCTEKQMRDVLSSPKPLGLVSAGILVGVIVYALLALVLYFSGKARFLVLTGRVEWTAAKRRAFAAHSLPPSNA